MSERGFSRQVVVKDRSCLVCVDGDTVLEYGRLERVEERRLEFQAHSAGHWIEYKHIRIKHI